MFLSIVILNYFSSDKVIDLIKSIKVQSFVGEVVIVDNSESTDEFLKLKQCETILECNPCLVVCSDRNGGFSYGTNFGISRVSVDATHVYILNPDTILKDGALKYLCCLINSLPDIIISPRGQRMDNGENWSYGGRLHYVRGRCDVDSSDKNYTVSSEFGTCASLIVPMDLIKKYGSLDEDFFLGGEEWEFSLRMVRNGVTIVTPSRVIYEHEISGTHKKYGLPFMYMGQRTKVLFMRKCFPKSFFIWFVFYLFCVPLLIIRYSVINKTPVLKTTFFVIKAMVKSIFRAQITKDEFFAIGDVK